ncbi:MAG: DUF6702 family protein [Bacteroidales bacterium]
MNKKRFLPLLLAAVVTVSGSWIRHEFYVSLTEIRYNPDTGRFEISMRIFPDDLDLALKRRHGISTHLATRLEPPEADSLLERYLAEHFQIDAADHELQLNYLGKEPESDAIWCYLESSPVPPPPVIRVRNSILIPDFPDQVNIVQVYVGEWNKGILLSGMQVSDTLKIDR